MFLPTTKDEMKKLGWEQADIILVSGDVYIDCYFDGIAIIGKVLMDAGYKVGVIAQPDINSEKDITRLGEPKLYWGVSAGCVDSMVANYTALKKKRRSDDLTPGDVNDKRPDRAVIKYTNLIKRYFKSNKPIVLGGVEASLRRIAHYDYWDDKIRKPIIFDAKADVLVYGAGEVTILELTKRILNNLPYDDVRGICYIGKEIKEKFIEIPSFDDVVSDKDKFALMFKEFYRNNDPLNAKGLIQKVDTRYLIQNPPSYLPTQEFLDRIHEFDYERDVHPYYKKMGKVKALDTVQFSVEIHRGCYGECNFCSITVHQGRRINSRSRESIIREIKAITKHKDFKGYISDIGGPTANMYENTCDIQNKSGACKAKRCSFPGLCDQMDNNHKPLIELMAELRKIPGIKKIFVGSGVRYDLVIADKKNGERYLKDIIEHHISGQMKIAPEHIEEGVLGLMGKPSGRDVKDFRDKFYEITKKAGKKQFLTYYFIAGHPGCDGEDMRNLKNFVNNELKLQPEQVQIFTPTPSTYSTLMYYTEKDLKNEKKIFVEKGLREKKIQKEIVVGG
jgi:uncharacterized radical SAM protein YgiQ